MPYSQQTGTALRALSGAAKQAGAEMLVRASSSETAKGSGGQPASHVKMRRPTEEQCFQSKPELVMMGQLLGLRKTRPQTP